MEDLEDNYPDIYKSFSKTVSKILHAPTFEEQVNAKRGFVPQILKPTKVLGKRQHDDEVPAIRQSPRKKQKTVVAGELPAQFFVNVFNPPNGGVPSTDSRQIVEPPQINTEPP